MEIICKYLFLSNSNKSVFVISVDWSIGLGPVSLVTDPLSDVMAVITQDRDGRYNSIFHYKVILQLIILPNFRPFPYLQYFGKEKTEFSIFIEISQIFTMYLYKNLFILL